MNGGCTVDRTHKTLQELSPAAQARVKRLLEIHTESGTMARISADAIFIEYLDGATMEILMKTPVDELEM